MSVFLLQMATDLLVAAEPRDYSRTLLSTRARAMEPMKEMNVSHRWIPYLDAEDARAILALIDFTVADGGTLGYASPMNVAQAQALISNLRHRVESGESHVLLGWVERQPAFLAILSTSSMANCRHRAELSKAVVHPDYRGLRLLNLGFREILQRAEALGTEQLVLDVREDSRAHQLWQRFGFQTYGILEDYARVAGQRHRGHFMAQSVVSLRARLGVAQAHAASRTGVAHA
jgi:ribosomal protein S18 acetylase RimI-like enzyme